MYIYFLQGLLLGVLGSNMIWNIKVMFAIDWYPQDKGFLWKFERHFICSEENFPF